MQALGLDADEEKRKMAEEAAEAATRFAQGRGMNPLANQFANQPLPNGGDQQPPNNQQQDNQQEQGDEAA